jgi:hypothetical protein
MNEDDFECTYCEAKFTVTHDHMDSVVYCPFCATELDETDSDDEDDEWA